MTENNFVHHSVSHTKRNISQQKIVTKTTEIWSQIKPPPLKMHIEALKIQNKILRGGPPPSRAQSPFVPLALDGFFRQTTLKYGATALLTERLFNVTLNPSINIFIVTVVDLNELQSFLIVALLACDHQK